MRRHHVIATEKARSGAERLPALRATCVDDLAACLGGHARAEPVAPLADQVRGLKGAFHRVLLRLVGPGARIRPPGLFEARAIGRWVCVVKHCDRESRGFCKPASTGIDVRRGFGSEARLV